MRIKALGGSRTAVSFRVKAARYILNHVGTLGVTPSVPTRRDSVWLYGLCSLLLLCIQIAQGQSDDDFMTRAILLAQQSQRETQVPASVTLAQAIWETGRGQSPIGEANNYFGIKATVLSDGTVNVGPIAVGWVWAWTKEWDGTRYRTVRERFRRYRSMEDSFRDHGLLLATSPRYAEAMRYVDDPREFARRIAAAGYATAPTYAQDLIDLMEVENLYRYDLPRDDAELVGQSKDLTLAPGQIFQIYFDVQNTGFGTWDPRQDYYFAGVNDFHFAARPRQELDVLVPPGSIKRWALTMVAPQEAGTFYTAWRMKHGAKPFGPEMSIRIEVREPARDGALVWYIAAAAAVVGGLIGLGWWVRRSGLPFF